VRYRVQITVAYLSSGTDFGDAVQDVLRTAMLAELRTAGADVIVSDLAVQVEPERTAVISATLLGASPAHLTSPLDAVTRLDTSLSRALIRTGTYEEFDVARRTLHVDAAG
jgi:hypothetical protein